MHDTNQDMYFAALPLRSLLRDQGLFKRPFGQNWSLFSLFLKPKSPFQFQNITIVKLLALALTNLVLDLANLVTNLAKPSLD